MGFLTGITNLPPSDDGAALGSATLRWSDLFLASGGVINWDGSDVTITHSSNTLTLAGGTLNVPTASSIVAGTSTSNANLGGVLSVNTTAVGNVGTGDDDLMTYTLPANTLNVDGRAVRITAWGTVAGTGNRYVNAYFGAQSLSGNQTYGGSWYFTATVVRTGAATQEAVNAEEKPTAGPTVITRTTPTETLSGAVVIKVVGNAASGNNDDIVQRGMIVEVLN